MQRTVFEEVVQPLVDCTFQGYNATVFAYGPSPPPRTSRARFAPSCHGTGARARPFGSLGALALRRNCLTSGRTAHCAQSVRAAHNTCSRRAR